MSSTSDDLTSLFDSLLDRDLDGTQQTRLNDVLRSNTDARRIYREYLALHAMMVWQQLEQATTAALQDLHLANTNRLEHAASDLLPPASEKRSPVLGLLNSARALLTRPVTWAVLFVAAIFYGTFALLSVGLRPDQLSSLRGGDHDSIAQVTGVDDATWPKHILPLAKNDSLPPNEPITLDSGSIEVKLRRGAMLSIEGPAKWSIDGENQATLISGRLVARVPQSAIGFTVTTPTAEVVDLGTEFTVQTDSDGTTEVQVLKGKVELRPATTKGDASRSRQPVNLSAGYALRVEPARDGGLPVVREIVATLADFNKPRGSQNAHLIYVDGAVASSTQSNEVHANNLINGRGLSGERHSATVKDTMWYTAGNAKGEYVLFDLVQPYQLESMKVWNFNDPYLDRPRTRGVKQASIYASNTSKGLPTEPSGDWRLIAAHVLFEPADGTPDYSTPKAIPLHAAEARFVAIVIEEALGNEPEPITGEPIGVGLSEVQFFGSRVEVTKPTP